LELARIAIWDSNLFENLENLQNKKEMRKQVWNCFGVFLV
jgi:hypothetical protein